MGIVNLYEMQRAINILKAPKRKNVHIMKSIDKFESVNGLCVLKAL
jgi:hypothetical protein